MSSDAAKRTTAPVAQTVQRALTVLSQFTVQRPKWRTSDLARELGANSSTMSRLLGSLEHMGFVEREPRTSLYRLGLQVVTLGSIALVTRDLVQAAIPGLAALTEEFGATSTVAILRDRAVFPLLHFNSPLNTSFAAMPGLAEPIHGTALGAVLIASLERSARERILVEIQYPRLASQTATTPDQLRRKALHVAEFGYAFDDDELALGSAGCAAPIRGADGLVIAACGIRGTSDRIDLPRRGEMVAARVMEVASGISRQMGYVVGVQTDVVPVTSTDPLAPRGPIPVVP